MTFDPDAGRRLFEEVTGRTEPGQWSGLGDVGRASWSMRAAGELRFIPSTAVPHRKSQKIVIPVPAPEVPAREAEPGELPGGAARVIKVAREAGWEVTASYCRGPWSMQTDHTETDEGDDLLTKYGQADSVVVRGWTEGRRFAAMWLRKPWTKAGQKPDTSAGVGGYQLEFAQVRPGPTRLVDVHPDKTYKTVKGKRKLDELGPTERVAANGKVTSSELVAFIKGEEINQT